MWLFAGLDQHSWSVSPKVDEVASYFVYKFIRIWQGVMYRMRSLWSWPLTTCWINDFFYLIIFIFCIETWWSVAHCDLDFQPQGQIIDFVMTCMNINAKRRGDLFLLTITTVPYLSLFNSLYVKLNTEWMVYHSMSFVC